MRNPLPSFPPLLTGHSLAANIPMKDWTRARAMDRRLGAGDFVWAADPHTLRFALVLEPEVKRSRCPEILFAAMVAAGDAIGALGPPEIAVTYSWPAIILLNEAQAGFADLDISETAQDDVPDWMILSLQLAMRQKPGRPEPGHGRHYTTLWDEGCGALSRTMLLESISRHLINLIHNWTEDGFKSIHQQWWGRLSPKRAFAKEAIASGKQMSLLGLDENGNALVKTGDGTEALEVMQALEHLRKAWEAG